MSAATTAPTRRHAASVTPEMLAAGKRAFLQKRDQLDDLRQFFDSDLDAFLSAVYRAMAQAA